METGPGPKATECRKNGFYLAVWFRAVRGTTRALSNGSFNAVALRRSEKLPRRDRQAEARDNGAQAVAVRLRTWSASSIEHRNVLEKGRVRYAETLRGRRTVAGVN